MDTLLQARITVVQHVNRFAPTDDLITVDDLNPVWYSMSYDNWRVLFSCLNNAQVYDVVYNAAKKQTEIDTYVLVKSIVVDDDPIETLRTKIMGKAR